jgi:hypothetical protein
MPGRAGRCREAAAGDPEAAGAAYGACLTTVATTLRQPRAHRGRRATQARLMRATRRPPGESRCRLFLLGAVIGQRTVARRVVPPWRRAPQRAGGSE